MIQLYTFYFLHQLCSEWLLNGPFKLVDWLTHIYPSLTRKPRCRFCKGQIVLTRSWSYSKLSNWRFTSYLLNLLLVRSHQAEIIIVKRLIQGPHNVTRVQIEKRSCHCKSVYAWVNLCALLNKIKLKVKYFCAKSLYYDSLSSLMNHAY